ncbi:MAG: response regulator, partial [Phycisphaerales bacterium]|nr:response regulator [Phycisphaerales bacterium]
MTRVLLVDDLAIFREPLAAVLRQHGFEVEVAANGSEALQQARAHHPDIVLLDAAMPVMDGVVCAQHMRNDPQLREIPIIMLTAISDRDVIANAARAGVRNYMLKSQFTTEELLARIRKTLRTAPADLVSEDSAPPSSEPPPAASPELTVETPPVGELSGKQLLATIREHMEVRSIKPVLQHVLALTRSSHSSFDEIAAAIRQDPALAMKVMKVANSSYYRTGNPATTLRDAEHRIGLSGIRNVTTAILAIEEFSEVTAAGLVPQRFWEHSLATAVLGERIAALAKTPQSEDLFLAGLLHDMGRLVLSDVLGKQYASLLGDMRNQDKCLDQFERERLQLSHADVTREILTLWKMPDHVIEAASLHHLPIDAVQRKARSPRTVLSLMLANRLSHA